MGKARKQKRQQATELAKQKGISFKEAWEQVHPKTTEENNDRPK